MDVKITSGGDLRPAAPRWPRTIPTLIFVLLGASYVASANHVRAVGAFTIAGLLGVVTLVQVRRGRGLEDARPAMFAPIASMAVLSRLLEDPVRWKSSLVPFVLAVALASFAAAGRDPRQPLRWAASGLAAILRTLTGIAIGAVILLPLGVARFWRRSDPLGTGRTGHRESAWHAVPSATASPSRSFRIERGGTRSTGAALAAAGFRAIGVLLIMMVLDLSVGATWDRVTGDEAHVGPVTVYDDVGLTTDPGTDRPGDPRESLPSLAAYPWAHEWFQEWHSANRYYWPYLLWRNAPYQGKYLNIRGWERRTYHSAGATRGDAPEVAMFGGSTTFGVAQRDAHTIISEITRLAEADDLPIRPHNYGVSGFVNWQEMLQFEQFVYDDARRPDIAIFYDGANEVPAQSEGPSGVPSHTAFADTAEKLGTPPTPWDGPGASAARKAKRIHLVDLLLTYRAKSASGHVARKVRGWLDPAAGAEAIEDRPPTRAEVQGSVDVYKRGRDLIRYIARKHHVDTLFFWQPRAMYEDERAQMGQIDAPTINISTALDDHQDVYIDGNHHNEEGAKIVAAAIWQHLKPEVAAWYDAHG